MSPNSPDTVASASCSAVCAAAISSSPPNCRRRSRPDPTDFVKRALPLQGLATAVNVTDGAGAKAHMATIAASHFLHQAGIEPILQMACRDRNRIALESDLLGALALGMHNFLVLTGDDPRPATSPTRNRCSISTAPICCRWRSACAGKRSCRRAPTSRARSIFAIGATDVPVDPPADWNPKSLLAKLDAGADFIQTQFCMDAGVVARYGKRLVELGIAPKLGFLIGLCPFHRPNPRSG